MNSSKTGNTDVDSLMRSPEQVMNLDRMGSAFQTRLSFMRNLVRKMNQEKWHFEQVRFDIDEKGFGNAVYSAHTKERTYSMVVFTHDIEPEQRNDRVVAEVWDATLNLFDGIPTAEDILRLSENTPKQEAGRFKTSELVLARANKSLRLCEHVTSSLADGQQPDLETLSSVGYLFRTTAVYGNGKFGCSDRSRIADRPEVKSAFAVELLLVYLFRWFTIQLVEHIAQKKGGEKAVKLKLEYSRYLGVGNSTGLGMAPFLVKHSVLLHQWLKVREIALARVRAQESATKEKRDEFKSLLKRCILHANEWQIEDNEQTSRIDVLKNELVELAQWCDNESNFQQYQPWNALYQYVESKFSLEGQEQTMALLLEPQGDLVDDLADDLYTSTKANIEPGMRLSELKEQIEGAYRWALEIDFDAPESKHFFWYYSEDKLEPRLGIRSSDPGAELEMPLAIGREVSQLYQELKNQTDETTVGNFVFLQPEYRYIIRRIQTTSKFPYAEIRDNLIGSKLRPLDLLRFKLAFFGASKFDPKSDLWTRINMYQGAPLPEELADCDADSWAFPLIPTKEEK